MKWLLSVLLLIASSGYVFADGVIRDGQGARSTGRGGVNLAFFDTGLTILDNPAGMSNINATQLTDFGFDVLFTDLDYQDPQNPQTSPSNSPIPVGHFAFVKKTRDPRFTIGVGGFSVAGFSSKYQLEPVAPFAGTQTYKAVGLLGKALGALSFAATDRLSIGANFGVAVNHMELEGPYFLQGPSPFRGTPTLLDLQATGAEITWATGLQYHLLPTTTVGVRYQSQSSFRLDGNSLITIDGLGTSRFDTEFNIVWPQSFGFGLRHEFNRSSVFGFDVEWRDWSSAFDQFGVRLTNPDNPIFANVIGSELLEEFPLNWRDVFSFRFGWERHVSVDRTVRAGYVFHRNPIPDSTLTPFIQATLEHAFSVGMTQRIGSCEFDCAYQFSTGRDRSVATSDFIGGDFDQSRISTSAHWASVGVIKRF